MRKIFTSLMLLGLGYNSFAQLETTLPALRTMYQASYANPAFMPKYKTSIGLPFFSDMTLGLNLSTVSLDPHTIVQSIDAGSGNFDVNRFYENMDSRGVGLSLGMKTDIFYVRFPVKGFFIGINSTVKVNTTTIVARDFVGFLANGNTYFAGKTIDFTPIETHTTGYVETGISLTKEIGKLSVGARVKYLQGIANVETNDLRLSVSSGANPPLYAPFRIAGGGNIRTSGLQLLMGDTVNGKRVASSEKEFDAKDLYSMKNTGWAFDIGATYQVTRKLNVHASVIDLAGAIKWKNRTYKYDLENIDIGFSGFNYEQLTDKDIRKNYLDSLKGLIKNARVTSGEAYTTTLPTRYYLGADYDLNKRNTAGFMFQGQQYLGKFYPAYTLSLTHLFGNNWHVTTNYSLINNTYSNIGLGTTIKAGVFQFFFVTDDVIAAFNPGKLNKIYLRLGFNLVFGEIKKPIRID